MHATYPVSLTAVKRLEYNLFRHTAGRSASAGMRTIEYDSDTQL